MKRLIVSFVAGLLLIGVVGTAFAEDAGKNVRRVGHNRQCQCQCQCQRQCQELEKCAGEKCTVDSQCKQSNACKMNDRSTCRKFASMHAKERQGRRGKALGSMMLKQRRMRAGVMEHKRGHMQGHMRNGAGYKSAGAFRFREKLGLSDKQVKQIEQIRKDNGDKIRAVGRESRQQIMKVLTPEQQQKLEQMRKDGGHSRK
ncbi:MAG: hypothetical protein PHT33_11485 [bacterium]|nr:hypothetical protein [bacterium]